MIGAALQAWSPNVFTIALLAVIALIYWRGWRRWRTNSNQAAAFFGGLFVLIIALESPLDTLGGLFLSAHMTQHLLLLMIAPPLLLLGRPFVPLLRGLPRRFVKDGIAPFLTAPFFKAVGRVLTAPPFCWLLFALSTLFWHLPIFYELALRSPVWHNLQHACFFWTGILFWWPIIPPTPGKRHWPEWTNIPYLLFADIVNTALSAFFIFSGKVLYPTYAAMPFSGLNPQDDQALAGAIMWVPGSIVYLLPAVVFAMRMLNSNPAIRHAPTKVVPYRRTSQAGLWTRRLPRFRVVAQIAMLFLAIVVVWDGFAGPAIAPLNLAGVLPWIHWRALSVIALLAIGNLFCLSCPFVLMRDAVARRILPANLRWPHFLRNKWPAIILLALYLWAYEAFSLWNHPAATAAIICAYFASAMLVDGLFRGASFCKYVCPIGQFHFVTSLVSPREVRVRSHSTCESCRTYDCIRGNATSRGCELDLFQPKKQSNLDCTFCMDCVKACPHDNVALLPVLPAETVLRDEYRSSIGRLAKRTDYAALALLVIFGGFVNAAGMTGSVMMWEHRLHARWGVYGMQVAVALFTIGGAILVPSIAITLCGLLTRLAATKEAALPLVRRFVFALVPVGVSMWAAHLAYHFITSWSSAVPAITRFAGFGAVVVAASVPAWLIPLQITLLDAGVLWACYLTWRLANQFAHTASHVVALWLPWAALALALYATGVWIVLQPMDMRGMM